jgi:hypothetical protein
MRRLFWLAAGVTIGALVMRRLSRIAERLTPKSVAGALGNALADLAGEVRGFAGEVRGSMDEREQELRAGTGMEGSLNGLGRQ